MEKSLPETETNSSSHLKKWHQETDLNQPQCCTYDRECKIPRPFLTIPRFWGPGLYDISLHLQHQGHEGKPDTDAMGRS